MLPFLGRIETAGSLETSINSIKLHDVASETTRRHRLKRVVEQRASISSWSSSERETCNLLVGVGHAKSLGLQYARSLRHDNLLRFEGKVYATCPTDYLAVPLHELKLTATSDK